MTKRQEQLVPLVGLVAAGGFTVAWGLGAQEVAQRHVEAVLRESIGFSGIIVGFLLTLTAIMYAFPDRPAVQNARDSGVLESLQAKVSACTTEWLVVASLGLVLGSGVADYHPLARSISTVVWLAFLGVGLARLILIARISKKLLRYVAT